MNSQTDDHRCVCGENIRFNSKMIQRVSTRWGEVRIVRCSACRLAQSASFPVSEAVETMYHQDKIYKAPTEEFFRDKVIEMEMTISTFLAGVVGPCNTIEIGANAGYGLKAFRNYGFNSVGVELNKACREYVSKEQNETIYATLADVPDLERYQLVFASHVIEHIDALSDLISAIRTRAPLARVCVIVPNFGALYPQFVLRGKWSGFIPNQHLWYFEPRTLRKTFERFNYRSVKVDTARFMPRTSKNVLKKCVGEVGFRIEQYFNIGHEIRAIFAPV